MLSEILQENGEFSDLELSVNRGIGSDSQVELQFKMGISPEELSENIIKND
jgi:hypothetical protein